MHKLVLKKILKKNNPYFVAEIGVNHENSIQLAEKIIKQVKEIFTTDQMLPAIGQGTIALQCKKDDQKTLNILQSVNDKETYYCIQTERALLEAIGGDCDTAIAGLAKLSNQKISLKSELFSNDGNKKFEFQSLGHCQEAKEIGYKVGKELLKKAGPDFTTQGN